MTQAFTKCFEGLKYHKDIKILIYTLIYICINVNVKF